jgi:hypothetical protein
MNEGEDQMIGVSWLSKRHLPPELDFFEFCSHTPASTQSPPKNGLSDTYVQRVASHRNVQTTITILNLLHKLTKRKSNRILAMTQWKAQAVLKRILKTKIDCISEPTLKLLKSQVPFLGKKWRTNNMMVISQIYMSIGHRLREDYLCGEGDSDPVEAQKKDLELRELVKFYNSRIFGQEAIVALNKLSSVVELELNDWIDAQQIPQIPEEAYEEHAQQEEAWIKSLVVDELDQEGGAFEIPQSWTMELLEEESLMNSFEMT